MTTVSEKLSTEPKKEIALPTFETEYVDNEQHKYEWRDGQVEQEAYLNRTQLYLVNNVLRKFREVDISLSGSLMGAADCYFSAIPSYRRPNLAYLTQQQIYYPEEAPEAPSFIVEVVHSTNTSEWNDQKALEYLEGGVQTVWYIYPDQKQVWVYTHPKRVTICHEGDVCSADPAITGFSINVDEIFSKELP